jgi:4-amino-4-deoxy-L-arabinose transferase-like glycosyltransferase
MQLPAIQLEPPPNPRWPGRRTEAIVLFIILGMAAFFRLYQLDSVPPGFTHDEAGHGMDAIAIAHGARPIYETVGYGREPLYDYIVAAVMPILGENNLTLRLVSVAAGLLLIVVMHFWVRRAFDVPIAIVASASLAVSFWAISTSRMALRSALLPVLFTASIYFLWHVLYPHQRQLVHVPRLAPRAARWVNSIVSGLFLGLSLYTYLAARVLPLIFALLWVYLLIFKRDLWKQVWLNLIVAVAVGLALAAPMFVYLAAHPGIEVRLGQLSGPIDQFFAGRPDEVFKNALSALGMFSVSGDNLWLYNIPGLPILSWPLAIMFYLGVVAAVLRSRRTEFALALIWLVVAIIPSLLTGVVASSLRSIAAQPIVYVLVGVGYLEVARFVQRVIYSHTLRALPLGALIIAVTVFTFHDYFDVWGAAPDVRVAYHVHLAEIARYADRAVDLKPDVAISAIYPDRFHDPYSMELLLRRRDLTVRWFTGSFVDASGAPHASLVFPATISAAACGEVAGEVRCTTGLTAGSAFTATTPIAIGPGATAAAPPDYTVDVIVPSLAPIDPVFAPVFQRHARLVDQITLRPDDLNPRIDVYAFDATAALTDALASAVIPTRTLDFDHTFQLIGYDLRTPRVRPGATAEIVTYWRVHAITNKELLLFTHALSGRPDRPVLAQQDSLDVPSWYWVPGDAFAQVHRLVIPAEAGPGTYALEVGAYTPNDEQRLMVYDDLGHPIGDHVLIGSIEVQTP